jgi:hypothetical protein
MARTERWRSSGREAGDVAALPKRLDGMSIVVLADEGHDFRARYTIEDREARKSRTSPSTTPSTSNLYALDSSPLPCLGQYRQDFVPVSGEAEIWPPYPAGFPRHGGRLLAE